MSPLDADPGVVTVLVAAALLGYHVAVRGGAGRSTPDWYGCAHTVPER